MPSLPPFTVIARGVPLLRGYQTALRANEYSRSGIAANVRLHEIFEVSIEVANPVAKHDQATSRWLARFLANVESSVSVGQIWQAGFIVFRDVGEHADGEQVQRDADLPFHGQEHVFLNIQLAGHGVVGIAGKEYAVGPGDAYLLDQRIDHYWRRSTKGYSRAFSILLPEAEAIRLVEQKCAGATLDRTTNFTEDHHAP